MPRCPIVKEHVGCKTISRALLRFRYGPGGGGQAEGGTTVCTCTFEGIPTDLRVGHAVNLSFSLSLSLSASFGAFGPVVCGDPIRPKKTTSSGYPFLGADPFQYVHPCQWGTLNASTLVRTLGDFV